MSGTVKLEKPGEEILLLVVTTSPFLLHSLSDEILTSLAFTLAMFSLVMEGGVGSPQKRPFGVQLHEDSKSTQTSARRFAVVSMVSRAWRRNTKGEAVMGCPVTFPNLGSIMFMLIKSSIR